MSARVFVRRSRHLSGERARRGGPYYWNVYDCRSPLGIKQSTFVCFEGAIRNADRIARGLRIHTLALVGFQLIDYGDHQDPTREDRR